MAASTTTSAVYIHVIEDVINKVREEFVNNGGPGDSVLTELQAVIFCVCLWMLKSFSIFDAIVLVFVSFLLTLLMLEEIGGFGSVD